MRNPPLEEIELWPDTDYDNPVRRGPMLLIVESIAMPLAMLCVVARLWVRIWVVKRPWIDDWLMAAAMVFCIGVSSCTIVATEKYGWDIHIWDVMWNQAIRGRKASIAGQTLYLLASTLVKISILVSYLRLAAPGSWFRRSTWILGVVVASSSISFLAVLWLQCIPIKDYWELTDEPDCLNEGPPLLAQAVVNVVTDLCVYLLPIPTLVQLQLPFRQRMALVGVFSAGLVAVSAGAIRTYLVTTVTGSYDVTWNGFPMWIWTAVEVNLGAICGCIPMLKPLWKTIQTRWGGPAEGLRQGEKPDKRYGQVRTPLPQQRELEGSDTTCTGIEEVQAEEGIGMDSVVALFAPPGDLEKNEPETQSAENAVIPELSSEVHYQVRFRETTSDC